MQGLHPRDLRIKHPTITTGLVDTHSTPTLPRMTAAGLAADERM